VIYTHIDENLTKKVTKALFEPLLSDFLFVALEVIPLTAIGNGEH
jgi:hypothetical protein